MGRLARVVALLLTVGIALLGCTSQHTTSAPVPSGAAQSPASSAPVAEPAASELAPSNHVGDVVPVGPVALSVAGGKMIAGDGQKYLALKIYAKLTAQQGDLDLGTANFSVVDGSGQSYDADTVSIISNNLPNFDTSTLNKGDDTAGWIAFPVSTPDDEMKLVVTPADFGDPVEISLASVLKPPSKTKGSKAFEAATRAAAVDEDKHTVTMDEYKQIRDGMSLSQVAKIVGWAGDESGSSGSYSIRTWSNGDGSAMTITFHGSRVQSKAQVGL